MPWLRNNRDEADPLKARRRQLEEQERLLAQRMSQLTHELQHGTPAPPPDVKKAPEPPVWRMEEDAAPRRPAEPAAPRPRNLGRQRQRDRLLFFLLVGPLLLALVIVYWLWKTHVSAAG